MSLYLHACPPFPHKDSVGNVRAGTRAKAQSRKGPDRRWGFPSESTRGEGVTEAPLPGWERGWGEGESVVEYPLR